MAKKYFERKVENLIAQTREFFPEAYGDNRKRIDCFTAQAYYNGADHVLRDPGNLEVDQIEDVSILRGLQRAHEYRLMQHETQ